jgi:ferredoxin
MKIKIIPEQCIACGLCHLHAPEVFDYHDDGIVKFYGKDSLIEEYPETDGLKTAVKACPTGALVHLREK